MNAKITNMQVAEAARRVAARDFLGAKAYIESVYQAAHTAWPAKWAQQAVLDVGPLRMACENAGVAIVRPGTPHPRRNPEGSPPVVYRGYVIEHVGRDFIAQPHGWRYRSLRAVKRAIDHVEDNIDSWLGRGPRKNPTSRDIDSPQSATAGTDPSAISTPVLLLLVQEARLQQRYTPLVRWTRKGLLDWVRIIWGATIPTPLVEEARMIEKRNRAKAKDRSP